MAKKRALSKAPTIKTLLARIEALEAEIVALKAQPKVERHTYHHYGCPPPPPPPTIYVNPWSPISPTSPVWCETAAGEARSGFDMITSMHNGGT